MSRETLFIDGQWVAGATPSVSINPATEEVVGEYSAASASEVKTAVAAARAAFPSWAAAPVSARADHLRAAAELLLERKESLRSLISQEMGKPMPEAEIEVAETADMIAYLAEAGRSFLVGEVGSVDQALFPGKLNYTAYRPLGVVGAIKPWNYPLELPAWSVAAAMLAGNTVVLKASELSPLVACEFVRCLNDAGVPKGVINLVTGGPDAGKALVSEHPECLSFTGSLPVGRKIGSELGGYPVRVHLELGGKDAFIVCGDANLELAARGAAWGAFTNCGQVCVSAERIIVVRSVAERFLALLCEETERLRVGDPAHLDVELGPLVSESALSRVERHIGEAVAAGASVLVGGMRPSNLTRGYFYLPTVLVDVPRTASVWREETFGPVAAVSIVDDEEEAVSVANDCDYDLGASLWTSSLHNGLALSERLRVGLLWVNDVNVAFPSCPWGGFLKSGSSKELSRHALAGYSGATTVSIDHNREDTRPWWYPYGEH